MMARRARWRTARRWLLWFGPIGAVATITVAWQLFSSRGPDGVASGVTAMMILITSFLSLRRIVMLTWATKDILLGKLCRFFGLRHDESAQSIDLDDFDKSGLLPPYDSADTEDQINGSYDQVEFDLVECQLWKRKWSDADRVVGWFLSDRKHGGPPGVLTKVYRGMLFRFRFPQPLQGRTWVVQADRHFKGTLPVAAKDVHRVTFEDGRLPREFEVWSSNAAEAHRLLSPAFCRRAVALAKAFRSRWECIFGEVSCRSC